MNLFGSPHRAAVETNPTKNHEVADSIPGLAQWVKDLALLCCTLQMWLRSGIAVAEAMAGSNKCDQTPSLGTSICC